MSKKKNKETTNTHYRTTFTQIDVTLLDKDNKCKNQNSTVYIADYSNTAKTDDKEQRTSERFG